MPDQEIRPTSWLRRFLIGGMTAIVLIGVSIAAWTVYSIQSFKASLRDMAKQLDQTDPNWRLSDLDKDIVPAADAQNNALLLALIDKQLPGDWLNNDRQNELSELAPEKLLDARQVDSLKKALARSPEAISLERRLAEVPRGYAKVKWLPDPLSTPFPEMDQARKVAKFAACDAMMQAQDRNCDGALRSCQALLSLAHVYPRNYTGLMMLVQISNQSTAINQIQRTLAQGEPSLAALEEMQRRLEAELAAPTLAEAMRGERASTFQSGEFIIQQSGIFPGAGLVMAKDRIAILEEMNKLVEASIKADTEKRVAFATLKQLAATPGQPVLLGLLLPALDRLFEAYLRGQAKLRCAITALAAERYRVQHQAWPDSLAALVPAEMKTGLLDPYDDQPLRLKRMPDGLVIYSVGQNRVDDGGAVTAKGQEAPLDTGFRLWDVRSRRQPAEPSSNSNHDKPEKD
jgi:hypothetical protein